MSPRAKLDVAGGSIRTSGDGTNSLFVTNMGGTQKGWFGYAGWMGGVGMYEDAGRASIILKNGKVGIGITNPQAKLDVVGTVRMPGFLLTGNSATMNLPAGATYTVLA